MANKDTFVVGFEPTFTGKVPAFPHTRDVFDAAAPPPPPPDPPTFSDITPVPLAQLYNNDPISFDVLYNAAPLSLVQVAFRYTAAHTELAFSGDDQTPFLPPYASSTCTAVPGGWEFAITRTGGWEDAPTMLVTATNVQTDTFSAEYVWDFIPPSPPRPSDDPSVFDGTGVFSVRFPIHLPPGTWDLRAVLQRAAHPEGPYTDLYAYDVQPAVIPSTALPPDAGMDPPLVLQGKTLRLRVDDRVYGPISLTSTHLSDVVAQINAWLGTLVQAYVDARGRLAIRTLATGSSASLRAEDGTALPALQLLPDYMAFGRDEAPTITENTRDVLLTDVFGRERDFYRMYLVDPLTGVRREYSVVVPGSQVDTSDPEAFVFGYVQLRGLDGKPRVNQEVTLHTSYLGQRASMGGAMIAAPRTFLTDNQGRVVVRMLRGMKFQVVLGGTSLARVVTSPTDHSIVEFDLLDPAYGEDDLFTVQRPDLAFAPRSNL